MRAGTQLPTFAADSKSAEIPNSLYGGGGGGTGTQVSTLDAESKSTKIPNSLYDGGGGGWSLILLLTSSENYKILTRIFCTQSQ